MQDRNAMVVDLVRKLSICFVSAADPDSVQQLHRYAMRILGSRLSPSVVADTFHVGDVIKKKLERQQRSNDVIAMANHLRKLHSTNMLKREWAVLYLLHRLGGTPAANSSVFNGVFHSDGLEAVGMVASSSSEPQQRQQRQHNAAASAAVGAGKAAQATEHGRAYTQYQDTVNTASEISDSVLLRDLVFVIQGIDGRYVKYSQRADGFVADADAGVPRATRHLIHKLGELGWLFNRVKRFVDSGIDNGKLGLVAQGLCAALREELGEYYRAVAVLEARLGAAKHGDATAGSAGGAEGVSLRRLFVWAEIPMQRFKLMAILADASKGALRGGALASTIHSYGWHGDPHTKAFVNQVAMKISVPIFAAVRRWAFEGELVVCAMIGAINLSLPTT